MDVLNTIWSFFDATTVILSLFVYWITSEIIKRRFTFQTFKQLGIPGPTPSFIYGNFHELQKSKNPMEIIMQWFQKYGDVVGYYEGWRPVLLVKDTQMIKLILIKYFRKFINRPQSTVNPSPPFQHSLIALEADKWKNVRNALTPVFSARKLKEMSGLMNKGVDVMLELINDKAKTKEEFDAFKIYQGLTMHVIGESVFALNVNCQKDPNDKFLISVNTLFRESNEFLLYLLTCFRSIGPIFFKILRHIIMFNFQAKRSFLVNTLKDVIRIRREDKEKNTIDMLQFMLEATKVDSNNESKISNEDLPSKDNHREKVKLSNDEVMSNSIVFLLAGFETTSNALAYITYLLTKHPDIQRKVQEEIDQFIGKEDKPDYETVNKFTKLDEVISESLRMYPPVTLFVSRECVEDCDVNGIVIPKGMKVVIPVWQIHHDPLIWPDPLEFRPERFCAENKANIDSVTWLPFGDGPRNCIGMRFALLEIKTAMARMLRNFSFVPGEQFEEELQIRYLPQLMNPKNGVFIKAVPRD